MFATSLLRTIAAQDVLIAAGDGAVAVIGKSCSIFVFALFKSLLINSIFNLKNLFLNNILNTATTVNKLFINAVDGSHFIYEPRRQKTGLRGSDQVRHKPDWTITEDS